MKTEKTPQPVYLKNYQVPDFLVDTVEMHFDLHEDFARIKTTLSMRQNPAASAAATEIKLDGQGLVLEQISLNGRELQSGEYVTDEHGLTLPAPAADQFTLFTQTRVEPHKNLAFEGLFKSGGNFLTQCEPEGFRRMTYFPDRPDVMAKYSVTIEADKAKYPVLLSNGNRVATRDLGNGRHQAQWQDPFRKPSYLFALVAGDFGVLEDRFVTCSGREILLQIYTRHGHEDRCQWAMTSLKQAMTWDEERFGLEYDLDMYMIVVTDDFNMGAMENKGLNVFNSIYVLAKPETATDSDYHGVQGVVGHEYFHNWTGNRVTCRDWFQLSLKEGLTVFRDQEFSADMTSRAVRRIEEVTKLRTEQFAEDAGPMAHPIRPASYIEINNFYTRTIYEKGAEVIRMIHTIIGEKNFRKGIDKYFELFDGQAVRTEDFVTAMELASGTDLTQFKHWYDQAGTPIVRAETHHDGEAGIFELTLEQSCPPTPGQPEKKPFHIPVAIGLIDANGRDLPLHLEGEEPVTKKSPVDESITHVLHLKQPRQTFKFKNVSDRPVVSLLRGFSAPVRLEYACDSNHLSFQLANDTDPFCRWEAGQKLVTRTVQALVNEINEGRERQGYSETTQRLLSELVHSFGVVIEDRTLDPAFKALLLAPPSEPYLAQFFDTVYPAAIHKARETVISMISETHETTLFELHQELVKTKNNVNDAISAGQRSLRNICLSLLTGSSERHLPLALREFREARNMTEELGALAALNRHDSHERRQALQEFHAKWKNETLVINKWLQLQAVAPLPDTLERIQRLSNDPVFDETNPNKVASLYGRFGNQNPLRFHDPSGAAYAFIAERILEIDGRNPQLAARVVSVFNSWKRYEPALRDLMKTQLERILSQPNLSKNVFEIVSKAQS